MDGHKRLLSFDIIKFIAILGVVVLHTLDYGDLTDYEIAIREICSRWIIPSFIMVTGSIMLSPQKDITISSIFKQRIPRLLFVYLSWWFIYALYLNIPSIIHGNLCIEAFLSPCFHLWYLPLLIFLYILMPFCRKIVEDRSLLVYFLLIWFAISFIDYFVVVKTGKWGFPWHYGLDYVGFLMLGYFLQNIKVPKAFRYSIYLISVVACLLTIYNFVNYSEVVSQHIGPNAMLSSCSIFLAFKNLHFEKILVVRRFIMFIYKDLFGIYLVHIAWLRTLLVLPFFHPSNGILLSLLIALLSFILSLFSVKLLRRIPYLCKLVL